MHNLIFNEDHFDDFDCSQIWYHLDGPYSVFRYGSVCTLVNWEKMQNNEPFTISLPSLQPMEPLQSYLSYVNSHYKEYNRMMADVKADS